MERKLFAFVVAVCLCNVLAAQKKDEIVFSDAIQVDSSEYFMIPRLLDDENKGAYGKEKGIRFGEAIPISVFITLKRPRGKSYAIIIMKCPLYFFLLHTS